MGQVTSKLSRNDTNLPRVPRDIKFRVLIIGRANSGKTTILERVCDTTNNLEVYGHDQQGRRERVRSRSYWHV
jgi:septin family protein